MFYKKFFYSLPIPILVFIFLVGLFALALVGYYVFIDPVYKTSITKPVAVELITVDCDEINADKMTTIDSDRNGLGLFTATMVTDGNDIYYYKPNSTDGFSGYSSPAKCVLFKGVDSKTFTISGGISKDNNNVFIGLDIIQGADPKTFEIIASHDKYYKDKNNVYYGANKIDGADPKTTRIVADHYSIFLKDKNSVYYQGKKIDEADPDTFVIISDMFRKDKTNVYYGSLNKIVQGADPKTFEVLSTYEGKDKDYFYFQDKRKEN